MVIVDKLVERRLAGETEVLGEILPHHHFVHHRSHMTRAAAVGSRRLNAWAMVRHYTHGYLVIFTERLHGRRRTHPNSAGAP
jgi:hypothetical protein